MFHHGLSSARANSAGRTDLSLPDFKTLIGDLTSSSEHFWSSTLLEGGPYSSMLGGVGGGGGRLTPYNCDMDMSDILSGGALDVQDHRLESFNDIWGMTSLRRGEGGFDGEVEWDDVVRGSVTVNSTLEIETRRKIERTCAKLHISSSKYSVVLHH